MTHRALIVALSLSGRRCLVVGSGAEAELRTVRLLGSGAVVTIVAESLAGELPRLHESGTFVWHARGFEESDLDGQWLAILTERDAALAARIYRAAEARRVFFCAIDQPAFGSFSHLALATAGDLTIAVSTAGRVPALARHLRKELQRLLDESDFARFFEELAQLRRALPQNRRRQVFARALRGLRISGSIELPRRE
jgi:siroheme synthase-like protein